MSINFTRLSTRFGHLIAGMNEVNDFRENTLVPRADTVEGDYASVNPELDEGITSDREAAVQSLDSWVTTLAARAQNVLIAEVLNDKKLPSPTLTNCLAELVRQMKVAGESYNQSLCTLGSVTDVGSPTTNAKWLTTAKDGTGVAQDLIVPDSYLIVINQDDLRGGTTYAEGYSITGKAADRTPTDYLYPSGYGLDQSKNLNDPAVDSICLNADFNTFSVSNVPDNWTLVSPAAAGTNVFRVADDPRDGASGFSLRLLSTASGTIKLRQQVTLLPNTVYGAAFKVKPVANGSATASATSVTLRLVDSSGTVIADDASTNCTLSSSAHSVVTVGSGWNHGYVGAFITPKTLPTVVYLELLQTTDNAGADDYIDHVCLKELTPLYAGGPYLEGFSGKVRAAQDDAWTWAVTLTTGAIGDYIIRGLDRFLDLKSLGVRVPTSASPTQADALIA